MFKKITQWACLLAALLFALPARAVVIDNYAWQFPVVTGISGATDLQTTLQEEIQAILDAGDLAPLYLSHADQVSNGYTLYNEPGRVITTLAWAYPYLTSTQQTAVRTYVQNELNSSTFSPWSTFPAPHGSGAARELHQKEKWWFERTTFGNRPSVQTIYGLWLYGYRTGDWASVQAKWSSIKTMYTARSGQGNLYGTMCAHIAMARLAYQFADSATQTTALNNLQTQMNAGVTFSTIETNTQTAYNNPNMYQATQDGTIYRGFMFLNLSPEMGRYLLDNVNSSTITRHNLGKSTFPHWYVADISYFQRDTTGDEGTGLLSETRGMLFPIERWVVGANSTTLRKWIRGGAVGIGDCYWLEALVQTIEAHGTFTWTDIRSASAPNAPSGLTATAVSSSQINLAWTDNSTNETQFKIERKLGVGGTYAQINTVGANVTTYNDTGLTASTNYYYRVRANNASGDSAYSNEANATTQAGGSPPNAPSGLTATAVSSSQINLGWTDNSSNETQFKIERKLGAGGTYAQINTVGANVVTYNDTGLAASTNYYYRVRANNGSGDSAYSNEANATTQAGGGGGNLVLNGDFETGNFNNWTWNGGSSTGATISTADKHGGTYSARFESAVGKPEADQSFTTASGTQYTVTGWIRIVTQTGSDWGGFRIQVSDANWTNLNNVVLIQSTTGTNWYQFTFNFTAASTSSRLQIGQFAGAGLSMLVYVDDLSVTGPGGSPPAAPSGLSATAVSSSQINLAWTDNASNETGFKVERKLGAGGTYAQIATPAANATSYNDTGLAASTNYYYRVRATNGSGDSAYSNEANATTQAGPPAAPSNLTATAVSSSQINLAWTDNSSDETSFKIERKLGVGGTYAQINTVGANVTTYNDAGLAASTNYYYRVRANNAGGDSAYSNEANATTQSGGTGSALSFNGTSAYAAVNDAAALDIVGSAVTMEAFVKVAALPASGTAGTIFGREVGSSSGYTMVVTSTGAVEVRLGTSGNSWGDMVSSNQTWTATQWYHVAASYDGTNVRIFRDGVQIGTAAQTGTLLAGATKLYFGGGRYDWSLSDYLNGSIDEARLSKVARYTANFTPPSAAFTNDSNTVGLWHFSENTGTTSADSSGNSLTANLTNAAWTTGKF